MPDDDGTQPFGSNFRRYGEEPYTPTQADHAAMERKYVEGLFVRHWPRMELHPMRKFNADLNRWIGND